MRIGTILDLCRGVEILRFYISVMWKFSDFNMLSDER
jgi:hypothetical protein